MSEVLEQHRRYLPHYQESDQVISLTWRLDGELPQQIKESIKEMQAVMADIRSKNPCSLSNELYEVYHQKIEQYDEQLGKHPSPGINLSEPQPAKIIINAFHFYDSRLYELHAYCVMPNHIHLLCKPVFSAGKRVLISEIVRNLKGYTAKQIIKTGCKEQKVWRDDYFDRFIRSEKDYANTVAYILYNPVKAGLADHFSDWPYSYFWKDFP